MHSTVIHIGSNMGKREKYLSACQFLLNDRLGSIQRTSRIYETEAWGKKDQPDFLNQAFLIETKLSAMEVLEQCQLIETKLGRTRDEKWGPRTIDIDIIFYDHLVLSEEHLTLPHPRMHERKFVLEPVAELVPNYMHPVLNMTVTELQAQCKDESYVSV